MSLYDSPDFFSAYAQMGRSREGLSGAGDMELLIHVGVDTVAMNGDGFQTFVSEGDEVKAGQKLLTFDRKKIAAANHPDVVVVLLTNAEDFDDFKVTP